MNWVELGEKTKHIAPSYKGFYFGNAPTSSTVKTPERRYTRNDAVRKGRDPRTASNSVYYPSFYDHIRSRAIAGDAEAARILTNLALSLA